MEIVYIAIGVVIGVVGSMFLGVNGFTKKVEEAEEEIDAKEEHNEGK